MLQRTCCSISCIGFSIILTFRSPMTCTSSFRCRSSSLSVTFPTVLLFCAISPAFETASKGQRPWGWWSRCRWVLWCHNLPCIAWISRRKERTRSFFRTWNRRSLPLDFPWTHTWPFNLSPREYPKRK